MSFLAKYSGTDCAVCEHEIKKGDEVEYGAFDELMHVLCPIDLPNPAASYEICPRCFIELPVTGRCGVCFDDG